MSDGINPELMAAQSLQAELTRTAQELEKRHGLGSIILFATYREGSGPSRSVNGRSGNYYASLGAVRSWLVYEDAVEMESARRAFRPTEEDQTEDRS